jgi:hypothetical protein
MRDQEFDKIEDKTDMVEINTTATREHVGKIECHIRTIKEQSHALVSDHPFKVLPHQAVIHLFYLAVLWLNSLPMAAGVSEQYSPHKIVLGCKIDFVEPCITPFGSYVKAQDSSTITNTMQLCTFPEIFLGPTRNRQGTHKVFDIYTGAIKKPCTVMPLPMPNRFISVVNNWGWCHAKENKSCSLIFLNLKWQLYDWDNDNLNNEEGLIESDTDTCPSIPTEFPDIDLESEQPHHHHIVEVIEASKDKCIDVAPRNASLNNLPCNTPGVTTAVDEIKINDWMEIMQGYKDPYHNLPIHQTINVLPVLDNATEPTYEPTNTITPITDNNTLSSILIEGQLQSSQTPAPRCLTKASFNNKSYSDGYYKDGTTHITTNSGHNAKHPLPINPNPLMHILVTALIHYANPEAQAVAFEQAYSFKVGIKKFSKARKTAAVTKLTQLHDYQV